MDKLEHNPLSGGDLQLKAALKKKYQNFWNNLAFRRGQAQPIFTVTEADALLDRAAELVVHIRRAYASNGVTLPDEIEGHASDFLWTAVVLHLNPATFVRDLVHASLSDADGYFDGVSSEAVDTAIEALDRSYMQHEAKHLGEEEARLRADIVQCVGPVAALAKQLFGSADDTLIMDDVDLDMAKLRVNTLYSIKDTLTSLQEHFSVLQRQQSGNSGGSTPLGTEAAHVPPPKQKEAASAPAPSSVSDTASATSPAATATPAPAPGLSSSTPLSESANTRELLIKIGKVAKDVQRYGADLRSLKQDADHVDLQNVAGEQKVVSLQKKCAYLTNELMRDLLELDSIVSPGSDTRVERKKNVTQIQSLLDDCDRVRARLGKLQHELREQKAASSSSSEGSADEGDEPEAAATESPMEEGADDEDEADAEEADGVDSAERAEAPPSSKKPKHESRWATLRLRPQFDVQESRDGYTLQTYVPNMHADSIKVNVSEDSSTLTVEGFREPTAQEEQYMRRVLAERAHQRLSPEVEEDLLLRLGAGRYGVFREQYRLPVGGVDVDQLEATYKSGSLRIYVPKSAECRAREQRERQLQEQRRRERAAAARRASPYFGDSTSGRPFGGLFGDNDMWW
jgi:HSP20 family molecular chaperone IbpA